MVDNKNNFSLFSELLNDEQTIEAKWMAERMAHLYESIVVLEWAEKYEDNYLKLAEVYVHVTWGERKVGDEMVTVKYFHDIV